MGQRVVDQSGNAREEAQEDNDDDGAIERAESRLFGTIGRNDRGAYDITAFALAIGDFSHADESAWLGPLNAIRPTSWS